MNELIKLSCWLLLFWSQTLTQHVFGDSAADSYGRKNESITDGVGVDIQGYKAIIGILTTINTTFFNSYGTLGCYNTKFVDASREIKCYGDYSCSFNQRIIFSGSDGSIDCLGSGSCCFIDNVHGARAIVVSGAFSLVNSYVYGVLNIVSYGVFGLMNSIIDSLNTGTGMNVFLYGFLEGYNSTIICRNGHTCSLFCYGNGCFDVILIMENGSDSFILCNPSQATYCPIIVNLTEWELSWLNDSTSNNESILGLVSQIDRDYGANENELTPLWYAEIVNYIEEYEYKCNLDTSLRFDDYEYDINHGPSHHSGKIIVENTTDNDLSVICCRSMYSCSTYANLSYVSSYGTVYCGGYRSCFQDSDNSLIINTKSSVANVMCSGDESCFSNTIITKGNVTCGGYKSCASASIHKAHSLFCTADLGCNLLYAYGVSNIYLMAYSQNSRGMTIFSNDTDYTFDDYDDDNERQVMNVHIMAYQSGQDVDIYCHKTHTCNIYCYTSQSCDEDTTTIHCDGMCLFCFVCLVQCPDCSCCSLFSISFFLGKEPFLLFFLRSVLKTLIVARVVFLWLFLFNDLGPCSVICNETAGIECPYIETGAPTLEPTAPTAAPSNTPSLPPSGAPSQPPTSSPSTLPTVAPSFSPTTEPSNAPTYTGEQYTQQIKLFESIGGYVVIVGVGLGLIVLLLGRWYSRSHISGGDPSSDTSIAKFFTNVTDLWTDVAFAIILRYQQQIVLFYISLASIIVPYLMQCGVGIYFIEKWRRGGTTPHLKQYVSRYDIIFYLVTVIGGFYAAVSFLSSKLFYWSMFNFQLRSSEKKMLRSWRFVNVVLVENLTQLGVQIYYILNQRAADTSIVVFVSMVFTMMSLVLSVVLEVSVLCQWRNKRVNVQKYDIYCFFSVQMTIKCNELRRQHASAHSKLKASIDSVIKNCDLLKHDLSKKNTIYELEVYYIDNGIPFNNPKQIDVFFTCAIHTFDKKLSDLFSETFYAMAMIGHSNFNKLCEAFTKALHIPYARGKIPQYDIEMEILKSVKTRNKIENADQDSNDVDSSQQRSLSRSSRDSPVARPAVMPNIQTVISNSHASNLSISPHVSPHGIEAQMVQMFAVGNDNRNRNRNYNGDNNGDNNSDNSRLGIVAGDAAQVNVEIAFQQAQANAARYSDNNDDNEAGQIIYHDNQHELEGKSNKDIDKEREKGENIGENIGENDEGEGKKVFEIQYAIEEKIKQNNLSVDNGAPIGGKMSGSTNMKRDVSDTNSSDSSMDEPQVTAGMTTSGMPTTGAISKALANDNATTTKLPNTEPAIGDTYSMSSSNQEKSTEKKPFLD